MIETDVDAPPVLLACSIAQRSDPGSSVSPVSVTTSDERSRRRSITSHAGRRSIRDRRRVRHPDLRPMLIVSMSALEAHARSAARTNRPFQATRCRHPFVDDRPASSSLLDTGELGGCSPRPLARAAESECPATERPALQPFPDHLALCPPSHFNQFYHLKDPEAASSAKSRRIECIYKIEDSRGGRSVRGGATTARPCTCFGPNSQGLACTFIQAVRARAGMGWRSSDRGIAGGPYRSARTAGTGPAGIPHGF